MRIKFWQPPEPPKKLEWYEDDAILKSMQDAVDDYWRAKAEAQRRGLDWSERGSWPKELHEDLVRQR